ncbi:hypothetical protein ACFL5V_04080 [Fibrobacterota bacterium]
MLKIYFPIFIPVLFLLLTGCLGPDISGRWTSSYSSEEKGIGTVKMEYALNFKDRQTYSKTLRGTIVKVDMTKIFSQEIGIWTDKSGVLTLSPKICKKMDENFVLSETDCADPKTYTIDIKKGTWQFPVEKGRVLSLVKDQPE